MTTLSGTLPTVVSEPVTNPIRMLHCTGLPTLWPPWAGSSFASPRPFELCVSPIFSTTFWTMAPPAELRCRPVEELLGVDLFGPRGPLRQALLDRQMREGWRATLKFAASAPRLV